MDTPGAGPAPTPRRAAVGGLRCLLLLLCLAALSSTLAQVRRTRWVGLPLLSPARQSLSAAGAAPTTLADDDESGATAAATRGDVSALDASASLFEAVLDAISGEPAVAGGDAA